MWKIIILCTMITSLAAFAKVSYENYKVFGVVPTTQLQLELLQKLRDVIEFSYWKGPSWIGKEVLIMVPPHKLWMFYETMNNSNMVYTIRIINVQKLIDDTMPQNQSQDFDFKSYHTLDTIYANLDELAKQYPDKVRVIVAGVTYEGRLIKGVKVISKEEKPGIFIEGGIHAMGWISPATAMYILHQLLSSKDPNVRHIADNHNWFIFPIFNPDGYAYSFTHDRLWKKTRKPSNFGCIGSDPNRNWNYQWGINSSDPCSEIYPGNKPFSEIEMKAISQYINSTQNYFYAYISFHSFGQRLLFSYNSTKSCFSYYDELHRVGLITINALRKRYRTQYVTECMGEINALKGGLSTDYVAMVLRKPIVCTYELRDKGQYGFLLPPEQIIPTGDETLDSLIAMFNATTLIH